MYFHFPFLHLLLPHKSQTDMTDVMDIDPPAPAPAGNAMAAMMAASKKGKGKMELSQAEVDAKDKKDKEGLPWYVALLHYSTSASSPLRSLRRGTRAVERPSY